MLFAGLYIDSALYENEIQIYWEIQGTDGKISRMRAIYGEEYPRIRYIRGAQISPPYVSDGFKRTSHAAENLAERGTIRPLSGLIREIL
tara:strand:- start:724 stop:990 length:267 start_codon:yes stop_codon:yes gene_type:complete